MDTQTQDFLQSLADKLGTSIEKVYLVLVKQAKIESIKDITKVVLLSISAIILYLVFIHIFPYCKPKIPTSQYEFDREWPLWAQLSLTFTSIGIFFNVVFLFVQISYAIDSCITAIMNPESYAIETLSHFKQ